MDAFCWKSGQGSWFLVECPKILTACARAKLVIFWLVVTGTWLIFSHSVGNVIIPIDFPIFPRDWNHQTVFVWNQSIRVNWRITRHGCTAKSEVVGAKPRLFDCSWACFSWKWEVILRVEFKISYDILDSHQRSFQWFMKEWKMILDAFLELSAWSKVIDWTIFLHQPASPLYPMANMDIQSLFLLKRSGFGQFSHDILGVR